MKKVSVLRVYDRDDEYAMTGEKDFAIIPDGEDVDWMAGRIATMSWQSYTSYVIGTAEIDENEAIWCEILGGEFKEISLDVSKVNIEKRYRLF